MIVMWWSHDNHMFCVYQSIELDRDRQACIDISRLEHSVSNCMLCNSYRHHMFHFSSTAELSLGTFCKGGEGAS